MSENTPSAPFRIKGRTLRTRTKSSEEADKEIGIKHLSIEKLIPLHKFCQLCQSIYKLIGEMRTKILKRNLEYLSALTI